MDEANVPPPFYPFLPSLYFLPYPFYLKTTPTIYPGFLVKAMLLSVLFGLEPSVPGPIASSPRLWSPSRHNFLDSATTPSDWTLM